MNVSVNAAGVVALLASRVAARHWYLDATFFALLGRVDATVLLNRRHIATVTKVIQTWNACDGQGPSFAIAGLRCSAKGPVSGGSLAGC